MYNKISDFIEDWKYESEATLKVFENLTDDSLNFNPNENVRSPGRLAWHIVTSLGEMVHRTGLKFDATPEDAPLPSAIKEICDEYKRSSEGILNAVEKEWKDESLLEEGKSSFSFGKSSNTSPWTTDSCNEISRIKSSWRLWSCQGRMGKYGEGGAGVVI